VNGGGILFLLLPIALVLLLVNSQRKRTRQATELQSGLTIGAEVCTTSGLFGRVVSLTDREVVLDVAPGVHLRFDRRAIGLVVPSEVPDQPQETGPDAEEPREGPDDGPDGHPHTA
jgi:preprotein translocase subunit YajC